jgi:hypothetical protein
MSKEVVKRVAGAIVKQGLKGAVPTALLNLHMLAMDATPSGNASEYAAQAVHAIPNISLPLVAAGAGASLAYGLGKRIKEVNENRRNRNLGRQFDEV